MECETAQELSVAAVAAGRPTLADADRHIEDCRACTIEIESLTAVWRALGSLSLLEPSPRVGLTLHRRLRWEHAFETLRSFECWKRAALSGVGGFVLSVLLALTLPYDTMVAACRDIMTNRLPGVSAYLAAGLIYGLVPMAIGAAVQERRATGTGVLGALEASLVFLVVLLPLVILQCGNFPLALLSGFIAGIALGAIFGGTAGVWLVRRPAWVRERTN